VIQSTVSCERTDLAGSHFGCLSGELLQSPQY
jgi:hypothetical protein